MKSFLLFLFVAPAAAHREREDFKGTQTFPTSVSTAKRNGAAGAKWTTWAVYSEALLGQPEKIG